MPETTVCAYCSSVIPAGSKTCPMCGADNQPDYLAEIVAPPPVVAPVLPITPDEPEPIEEPIQPFQPAPSMPRVQPAPPANNTNRYILIGVIALVVVCLCIGAVLLAGLRGFLGV